MLHNAFITFSDKHEAFLELLLNVYKYCVCLY